MRLLVLWVTFSTAAMALADDATQNTRENRRAYEQAALTMVGNVDQGKQLFFDDAPGSARYAIGCGTSSPLRIDYSQR